MKFAYLLRVAINTLLSLWLIVYGDILAFVFANFLLDSPKVLALLMIGCNNLLSSFMMILLNTYIFNCLSHIRLGEFQSIDTILLGNGLGLLLWPILCWLWLYTGKLAVFQWLPFGIVFCSFLIAIVVVGLYRWKLPYRHS